MITRLLGFLVFAAMSFAATAQFSDDFSDGTLDPWQGDLTHFIINPGEQLQLNAPDGSTTSYIYVPVTMSDSMIWVLYLRLDFAPSTSNQLKVYLATDSPDFATATGYLLEIGASGDQDPLVLKYAAGGNEDVIATSVPGLVANQPVELTLQVKRSADGTWTVHDRTGTIPELLFSAQHNTTPLSAFNTFGFFTRYTDTRRDKFFFDDINIQAPQPDVQAPQWLTLDVIDQQTLSLSFDEPLHAGTANDANNYSVNDGIGNPDQVTLNGTRTGVTLHFANPFESLHPYMLQLSQLRDDAGNVMADASRSFTYTHVATALPNEILITEIMADPTPVIALPDAEYIELYNAGTDPFRLSDYSLKVGNSSRALPDFLLVPDGYVIITDVDFTALFTAYGDVVGIDLPSLTNSGTTIALQNELDEVIHEVSYSDDWYGDSEKADGGWSLEMKNPFGICEEGTNWAAASNLAGGTPGKVNSAWQPAADTEGPALLSLFPSSANTIVLTFSERLDPILMADAGIYEIQPAVAIDNVTFVDPRTVLLTLGTSLIGGTTYTLLPIAAFDCLGNLSGSDSITFGLIVDAQPGDVLINEILFNPASGGSRFIEVINVSDKFINLSTLAIGRLTMQDQDIYTTGIQAAAQPGSIIAFATDRADILSRYSVPNPGNLYEASLPSWDDDSDNASLLVNGEVIDSFTYDADWHHPLIADQNGVSLERVSLSAATTLAANWHSASSLQGHGTPTGPNSQMLQDTTAAETPYTLVNRIFSPNEDGFNDFLVLQFNGTSPDAITSVTIHDMEGRPIYPLANNELVGTASLLQWDGRNTDGVLADMGMYVIYVQMWHPDGEVRHYQSSCALVKQ